MQSLSEFMKQGAIATNAGSPYCAIALLSDDDYAELDSNAVDLPWIKATAIKDTTDIVEVEDEGEDTFILNGGKRTGDVEFTFIQQDAAARNLYDTLRGKRFVMVKEMSKYTINGNKQYGIFPYCMVNPTGDIGLPGNEGKLTVKPMISPKAMTLDLTVFTSQFNNVSANALMTIDKGTLLLITEEA